MHRIVLQAALFCESVAALLGMACFSIRCLPLASITIIRIAQGESQTMVVRSVLAVVAAHVENLDREEHTSELQSRI